MRYPGLAFVLFALVACRELPGACTEIGCNDGLSVRVEGSPPGPWEIDVAAGSTTHTFACPAGNNCQAAFFAGFLPTSVTVTVRANGKTQEHPNLTPTPRVTRPNGSACPPECQQPFVTVSLP